MSVARSKISPPRPARGSIDRQRLQPRLQAALEHHPLLLLQAPAGYGKTTALAALVAGLGADAAAAWVRLEASDDLPALVAALLAALDPLDLPWPRSERALVVRAAVPGAEVEVAQLLAQGLAACDRATSLIVFDDLHDAADPAVGHFVAALLDALPACWRLAIGTRTPPLPDMARRRLRGQVAEFGSADLAFDDQEVQALAQGLGAGSAADTAALQRRCQGWPAALRLALAEPTPSTRGDLRLFEDLCGEVIDQLPADLRRFLLHTALLPELAPARAAALSGDARAGEHLAALRRLGLFVNEVDDQGSLRLHELLRTALLRRLHQEEPQAVATLHRRAAASEADPLRRVEWWLAAGAEDEAARALLAMAAEYITNGHGAVVRRLLQRFAPARRAADPALAIVQAQLAWSVWDFDAMVRALQRCNADTAPELADLLQAYRVCAHDGLLQHAERDRVLATLDLRALAPLPRLLVLGCRLHAPQHDDELPALGAQWRELMLSADRIGTASAWYQATPPVGLALLPGTRPALQHYARATAELCAAQPNALRMWSLVAQGWLAMWQGDWDHAGATFARALADARWEGAEGAGLAHVDSSLALAAALRGDAAACRQHLARHAQRLRHAAAQDGRLGAYVRDLDCAYTLRVSVWLDDAVHLERAVARATVSAGDPCRLSSVLEHARAALDARGGRADAAARRWSALLPQAARLEGQGLASELRLRLAAAQAAAGRPQQARELLGQVVQALAPELEDGPALMAGRAVIEALTACAERHDFDPALRARLVRWRQRLLASATQAPGDATLTERERQVLELVAAGDSNKHIALRLDLSPHTVKRHVANILDKLQARTRGQAAAWWRRQPDAGPQRP